MTTIEGLAAVTRARGAMAAAPRAIVRRPFYIATSVLMGLMAVVGFWPTYFGPLVRGNSSGGEPLLQQGRDGLPTAVATNRGSQIRQHAEVL